jgi:response regulator of citrate/malate metabolism
MSPETADLIIGVLSAQARELSAQECGEAIGVSRVSARRYLEYFVRTGRVQVSLRYGSRGRPERRYLLSHPH